MVKNIAIDGLSGAGKSTVAKELAKQLNCLYIDTGAMYRSIALYTKLNNVNFKKPEEIIKSLPEINLTFKYIEHTQNIFINNVNVTKEVKDEEIGIITSKYIAVVKEVREFLVNQQREIATKQSVVMDGRDIGSVVLKDSFLKIYLDASVKSRSERRYKELKKKGIDVDYDRVVKDIEKRDYNDVNRKNSPLIQCEDAIYIDSSDKTIVEVVDEIVRLFKGEK